MRQRSSTVWPSLSRVLIGSSPVSTRASSCEILLRVLRALARRLDLVDDIHGLLNRSDYCRVTPRHLDSVQVLLLKLADAVVAGHLHLQAKEGTQPATDQVRHTTAELTAMGVLDVDAVVLLT